MNLPFKEENLQENVVLRTFSEETLNEELKWHWDAEDRIIYPQHKTDWQIQIDNQLPEVIISVVMIKAGEWHRVIKGSGSLTVKIEKYPPGYLDQI